jgi:hypothetical protein
MASSDPDEWDMALCPLCYKYMLQSSLEKHVEDCIEKENEKEARRIAGEEGYSIYSENELNSQIKSKGKERLLDGEKGDIDKFMLVSPIFKKGSSQSSETHDESYARNLLEEERQNLIKQRLLEEMENEKLVRELLEEEERVQKEQQEKQQSDNGVVCAVCEKSLNLSEIHILDNCAHFVCHSCIVPSVEKALELQDTSLIRCLVGTGEVTPCQTPLSAADLKLLLTPTQYNQWQELSTESVIFSQSSFIRCPTCSLPIERVMTDSPQRNLMDTKKAHHALNRLRCLCSTVFCAECLRTPYHDGFTCAQYESYCAQQHCRWCHGSLSDLLVANGDGDVDCCNEVECQEKRSMSCGHTLSCAHACSGTAGSEGKCPPCLQCTGEAESFCTICYVETLEESPCLLLECGHTFHTLCLKEKLRCGWPKMRMTFNYLLCPLCSKPISHPMLEGMIKESLAIRNIVQKKAVERLQFEGLLGSKELKAKKSPYFKNPEKFAMDRYVYYQCYQCKEPYFAGEASCENAQDCEFDASELICGSCSAPVDAPATVCPKHGTSFIEYKCKFCCNVATFYCWGSTHFCGDCHKRAPKMPKIPRDKLPPCSCKRKHPPNGVEFCLGCSYCRVLDSF